MAVFSYRGFVDLARLCGFFVSTGIQTFCSSVSFLEYIMAYIRTALPVGWPCTLSAPASPVRKVAFRLARYLGAAWRFPGACNAGACASFSTLFYSLTVFDKNARCPRYSTCERAGFPGLGPNTRRSGLEPGTTGAADLRCHHSATHPAGGGRNQSGIRICYNILGHRTHDLLNGSPTL